MAKFGHFCVVIVGSISLSPKGYGNIVPITTTGRILTIIYALLGLFFKIILRPADGG